MARQIDVHARYVRNFGLVAWFVCLVLTLLVLPGYSRADVTYVWVPIKLSPSMQGASFGNITISDDAFAKGGGSLNWKEPLYCPFQPNQPTSFCSAIPDSPINFLWFWYWDRVTSIEQYPTLTPVSTNNPNVINALFTISDGRLFGSLFSLNFQSMVTMASDSAGIWTISTFASDYGGGGCNSGSCSGLQGVWLDSRLPVGGTSGLLSIGVTAILWSRLRRRAS